MSGAGPRVAFDVTPLTTFRTGIGYSVQEMWRALGAHPDGPVLVPYALGWRTPRQVDGLGAPLRSVRLPTRALLACWSRAAWPGLDGWLRGVDVVHATNYVVGPSRQPTVVTVNDIGFVLDPASADRVVSTFPAVLRRALARGAHVHVTTEHVAAEVEEHFGPGLLAAGRIAVVPFGIPDLGRPGPLSPGLAGVAAHPYVLALGAQEHRKNLVRLVEAFGRVAGHHRDARLVLAGPDGPATPDIRAAVAALPVPHRARVTLAGPLTGPERRTLLAAATVLAYPSLYEGFGFPALEAMSLGVPVVAGRAGALPEVVGGGAALVDPLDVDDLAGGLDRLLGDPASRAALADAGRHRASGFSWEVTAAGLADLYRRLATSS